MLQTAFSPWPSYTQEEADAVSAVLLSNKVNQWTGPEVGLFEEEFAALCETKHAVALANGSVALELALRGLGLMNGDEVITTPRSFLASASSIVMQGGIPVFADIDLHSQNIDPQNIVEKITVKTKGIIAVHLNGFPCDMDRIMEIASAHNLFVIEDCAQAHGARYKGRPVGSIGHVGAWSFCQDKIISTAGEGGMVTTNDSALYEKMWSFKDHGRSKDAIFNRTHPPGFRYTCDSFGTNWRMTSIQAAVGRIQLRKLENWHAKRTAHARRIYAFAQSHPAYFAPTVPDTVEHGWYKCPLLVEEKVLREDWDRNRIVSELQSRGIPCLHGHCPEIYKERAFETIDRTYPELPVAIEVGNRSLLFLVHPTLSEENMESLIAALNEVGNLAMKAEIHRAA